ncbi:MAG TPA: M20/M25/M40 family metallo-hydrolase [Thermoanaerobaculia bacterium]|nr:M20/M25/M40 family metallo-hydrolase [Thermoanaerobaculia bacterium]
MIDDAARKRRHRNERIVAATVILILAAATVAILRWQQRETEELRSNRTYIPHVEEITPEILLLQEYVRIDTSTPAGAAKGARWIANQLAKRGVRAEIIASAPDRLNVYARIPGKSHTDGLLLFNHIDVVPPGDGWSHPAFNGAIALNMMWGRGTLDMKGIALCQLLAFAELAQSGDVPAHDLVFLATADEETGSEYGMRWLLAHRPDVFAGIRYGISEGGLTELLAEQMTYFGIETASKQLVDLTIEGRDLASMEQARFALEPYMFARDPQRVLPEVREYFRSIAPTRYAFRPILSDIDAAIARGEFWLLPPAYRDLTQDSVWATAPQHVGDRWEIIVRLINLPDANPDERIAWLAGIVAPYGAHIGEVRTKEGPVPPSPHDTPLFRILAAEAEQRYRVAAGAQILFRSTTDARFVRAHGIICYGVSPFPVDYYQSKTIHHADERVRIDAFMTGIGFMKNVVTEWARGGA